MLRGRMRPAGTKSFHPCSAEDCKPVAVQIPLSSLSDDATTLQRFLKRVSGPAVLVGHSYGGAVITAAGSGNPNVKALVYIAAMAPDEGETVGELLPPRCATCERSGACAR